MIALAHPLQVIGLKPKRPEAKSAGRSRIAAWLLGGLNFQIEHHLLPRICHVNFPALSPIVEETCREYGVKYNEHPSFRAGLASHFRWLRQMGIAEAARCRGQDA